MSAGPRFAIALVAAIFLSVWFASSVLRWMPSLQYAFCGVPRGAACTAGTLMFAYAYYAQVTVPLASLLLGGLIGWLLGRPGPAGRQRPAGIALAAVLLCAGALFQCIGFAVELGVRRVSGQWTNTAVVNLALTPLLALGGLLAAWLLWRLRPTGRWLGVAVLSVTVASTFWTLGTAAVGILQSPVPLAVLALRVLLLGYLLATRMGQRV